jgi:hypothetical protein
LIRAVPTALLAAVVVLGMTAPAGAQQAQGAPQPGQQLVPLNKVPTNVLMGRLANETDPLARDAITQELGSRTGFYGFKADVPVAGIFGGTGGAAYNPADGRIYLSLGAYGGKPDLPTLGKVDPNPNGLNGIGNFGVKFGDQEVKGRASFNIDPDTGQFSATANGKVTLKTPDGRGVDVGVTMEYKDGQLSLKTENGQTFNMGRGSIKLDPLNLDQSSGSIQLKAKSDPDKSGPGGLPQIEISANFKLTADRTFKDVNELAKAFTDAAGMKFQDGVDPIKQLQDAVKQLVDKFNQQMQNQQQQDQQDQQNPNQDQQPADQNQSQDQQPGEQNQQSDQQVPTVLAPDGNQQASGDGQTQGTQPASTTQGDNSGSTADGNSTSALAGEMAGTDYTGAYDPGGTADYSGNSGTASTGSVDTAGASTGSSGSGDTGNASADTGASSGSTDSGAVSGYDGGDYTGAYDSGPTADYSGGYATDYGAGDASCACF